MHGARGEVVEFTVVFAAGTGVRDIAPGRAGCYTSWDGQFALFAIPDDFATCASEV